MSLDIRRNQENSADEDRFDNINNCEGGFGLLKVVGHQHLYLNHKCLIQGPDEKCRYVAQVAIFLQIVAEIQRCVDNDYPYEVGKAGSLSSFGHVIPEIMNHRNQLTSQDAAYPSHDHDLRGYAQLLLNFKVRQKHRIEYDK